MSSASLALLVALWAALALISLVGLAKIWADDASGGGLVLGLCGLCSSAFIVFTAAEKLVKPIVNDLSHVRALPNALRAELFWWTQPQNHQVEGTIALAWVVVVYCFPLIRMKLRR